jgi:hypothetical protein
MALALDRATVAHVERLVAGDRMPLPEALSRRLGVESWMLTLGEDGRLRAITILAAEMAPLPAEPPVVRAPPPALPPLERPIRLPPDGVLARIVGGATATGRQLADLALRRDDAEIRGEAVRAAVDAMLEDPSLERALLEPLEAVDDAVIAQAVSGIAGEAATELLSIVAERAPARPLGRRAARVLERLRGR